MGMHTHYHKGTPLYIILRNGETLEGKFQDHKSGCIILEGGKKVLLSNIRSMSPRKLDSSTLGEKEQTI